MEFLIILIAIVVVISLIMGIYSTHKHFKIKEQEIGLERERLALERRRVELAGEKV